MALAGFLCLGIFIGWLTIKWLLSLTDVNSLWKAVIFVVTVVLSVGLIVLIQSLMPQQRAMLAVFAYPIGLLVGMAWANWEQQQGPVQLLGTSLLTLLAATLVIPPAFIDAWSSMGPFGIQPTYLPGATAYQSYPEPPPLSDRNTPQSIEDVVREDQAVPRPIRRGTYDSDPIESRPQTTNQVPADSPPEFSVPNVRPRLSDPPDTSLRDSFDDEREPLNAKASQ